MPDLYPVRPGYARTAASPVLIPMPGKVPVTAGHWHRATPTARVQPKPRLAVKPTGGKVDRLPTTGQRKRKTKRTTPAGPSNRELHAAWAKGNLEF